MWQLFIALHALAAVISFAAGLYVLEPARAKQRPSIVTMYLVGLAVMLVAMVAATISHWGTIDVLERIIFSGLPILGGFMLYRGLHARRLLQHNQTDRVVYIQDIGFTLISYANGFVIVGAIDLGAPAWVVAFSAVLITVVGSKLLTRAKKRL